MGIIYVKINDNRKKYFQTKCYIKQFSTEKIVVKESIYNEGIENIKRISECSKLAKELYGDMYVDTLYRENRIEMKYIDNAVSLSSKLYKALNEKKEREIERLLLLWKKCIIGNENNITIFKSTKECENYFGIIHTSNVEATKISNLDCTCNNILFRSDERIKIIDYEWIFKFSLPIEFIMYYGIVVFSREHVNMKYKADLCRYLEISEEQAKEYDVCIEKFWDYVSLDAEIDNRKLGDIFLKPRFDTKDCMLNVKYNLPNELLDVKRKYVVYGAGSVGSDYVYQIRNSDKCELVCWIDKDAKKLQLLGLDVKEIEDLVEDFDMIIIAILNLNVVKEVRDTLKNRGICEEKICWIDPIL